MRKSIQCLWVAWVVTFSLSAAGQDALQELEAFNRAHEAKGAYGYDLKVEQQDGAGAVVQTTRYTIMGDNAGKMLLRFANGSENLVTKDYKVQINPAAKLLIVGPVTADDAQDQWKATLELLRKSEHTAIEQEGSLTTVSYQLTEEGVQQKGRLTFSKTTNEVVAFYLEMKGDMLGNGQEETVAFATSFKALTNAAELKAALEKNYIEINGKDIQPTEKFNDYEIISTLF